MEAAATNEQLKIHDKMQNEFINIASRELRTPAQSIICNAELAVAHRSIFHWTNEGATRGVE